MLKYCCDRLEIPLPEHTRGFGRTGTPFVLSHNRILICCPNVSLGTAFRHQQFFLTSNRAYLAIAALCALPPAPLTQPQLLSKFEGACAPLGHYPISLNPKMKSTEPATDYSIVITHYEYHELKWPRKMSVDFFFFSGLFLLQIHFIFR